MSIERRIDNAGLFVLFGKFITPDFVSGTITAKDELGEICFPGFSEFLEVFLDVLIESGHESIVLVDGLVIDFLIAELIPFQGAVITVEDKITGVNENDRQIIFELNGGGHRCIL